MSKSSDKSTSKGRSEDRLRCVSWAAITEIAARILNRILSLILLTITLDYLGAERYRIWLTIISTRAVLSLCDLETGSC